MEELFFYHQFRNFRSQIYIHKEYLHSSTIDPLIANDYFLPLLQLELLLRFVQSKILFLDFYFGNSEANVEHPANANAIHMVTTLHFTITFPPNICVRPIMYHFHVISSIL